MILKLNYKDWQIYYNSDNSNDYEIGEKIIDEDFSVIKVLKDTNRNYVSIIKIRNKFYVLKEIRAELSIPQRRFLTFLKKGEALTTLKNGVEAIKNGINEIAPPRVAIVKRKIFIEKSFIVLDYIDGVPIHTIEDVDKVVELMIKIHKNKRYHGDFNTSNFIKGKDNNIYILDSQMKKAKFSNYRESYDYLTFKEDLLVKLLGYEIEDKYIIEKNRIGYRISELIKKIKNTNIVKKIRKKKKMLRKKGWKI